MWCGDKSYLRTSSLLWVFPSVLGGKYGRKSSFPNCDYCSWYAINHGLREFYFTIIHEPHLSWVVPCSGPRSSSIPSQFLTWAKQTTVLPHCVNIRIRPNWLFIECWWCECRELYRSGNHHSFVGRNHSLLSRRCVQLLVLKDLMWVITPRM